MNLPDCVWYVSGFRQPWEADIIGNLAEALKNKGVSLRVYVKGGTAHLNVENVMSWSSLTFFERIKEVLFGRKKLWHLWGDAPFWWGLVRLRARTVHTSLNTKVRWRGHPTRLFKEQARDGENRILPTFEPKAAWVDRSHPQLDDEQNEPMLIQAWKEDTITHNVILESWTSLVAEVDDGHFANNKVLVVDGSPSAALQAAFMTMRGVPVVARDAPLIREVLGPGGYAVAPPAGDRPEYGAEWKKAFLTVVSDGRSISAAARHFLKENYGAPAAAESLINLYEAVGRGC